MRSTIVQLPVFERVKICTPRYAAPDDVLAVELTDDALASERMNKGDHVVIYLPTSPDHGQPGAVRAYGQVFIGLIFYGLAGDVFIVAPDQVSDSRHFFAGEYAVIGALKRICKG